MSAEIYLQEGISLRDHFAGLAMQGFISLNKFNTDMSVKLSYDMADAMLAEKAKNVFNESNKNN